MTQKINRYGDRDVPLDAFSQYMREVTRVPWLSEAEEYALLECMKQARAEWVESSPDAHLLAEAERAQVRLIEGYQRYVIFVAKKYVNQCRYLTFLDLIQEGNVGLLEAMEKFTFEPGVRLVALARFCVHDRICDLVWQHEHVYRLPRHLALGVRKMIAADDRLFMQLGRDPSVEELARDMKLAEHKVRDLIELRQVGAVSLSMSVGENEDCLLEETIEGTPIVLQTETEPSEASLLVQQMLSTLPERQRRIIELRFGLSEEDGSCHTLDEVGQHIGRTGQTVSGEEMKARRSLHQAFAACYTQMRGERVA